MMNLKERVARYQFAMAMARNMLSKGMITEDNYHDIDTIMTKKYGLSLQSALPSGRWCGGERPECGLSGRSVNII